MEDFKKKFNEQAQKVKLLQAQTPNYASCPGNCGHITFATLISKHKYIKEYLDHIDTQSISLSDKFKLNGVPIEFGVAEDTRDANLRYLDTTSRFGRAFLMGLMLLIPIVVLASLLIGLSYAFTIDQPSYCVISICGSSTSGSVYYYIAFSVVALLIVGTNCAIRVFVHAFSSFLRDHSRVALNNLVQ